MQPHSVEKKLELIHSIRLENQNNRGSLRKRERLLFGESLPEIRSLENLPIEKQVTNNLSGNLGFKIRIIIAVLLFTSYVLMEVNQLQYYGIDTPKIHQIINETIDYSTL